MKNFNSIKKNRDFQTVYQQGKSYANKLLVMYVMRKEDPETEVEGKNLDRQKTRIGISVSKKVGNSVVRSRSKRLIGESYRLNTGNIKEGYDFVFVARTRLKDKSYNEVTIAMINLFKKAGLY